MKNGGFCEGNLQNSKYLSLTPSFIPRGCYREIKKYQYCAQNRGADACLNDKLSIMEVCPDHILEALREKKKWYLRAEVIDNQTYKRAMQVSDYNRGRSVSELKLKTWEFGKGENLKSDSLWQDDRYNPTKYSHPHRYDNVNFPEQEYKDIFGGTLGNQADKEKEFYQLGFNGSSKASEEYIQEQRSKKQAAHDAAAHSDVAQGAH